MSPERGRGHCARTPDPCNTAPGVASKRLAQEGGGKVQIKRVLDRLG